MPVPVVTNTDPNFETRLRDAQQQANAESGQRNLGQQTYWWRPSDGWNGDLFDVEGMHAPFDRGQANDMYLSAVDNAQEPGTVGDIVITTTMIDYLAMMERALRLRYLRRPRSVAQLLGRKNGQGDPAGYFLQNVLAYIQGVMAQNGSQE